MERSGTVQAVDRAMRLLEALAPAADGIRLADVARDQGLAPSTAHRLLTTLEQSGFVQFEPISLRWQIGKRAFMVGIAYTRWQSLIATAQPFLRRLRDETRETVNLGVLDDGEVITVAQVESRQITRAIAAPGGRTPVMNSGMGKAMVASWPDSDIAALIAEHGLRPMTSFSLKTPAEAKIEIARIRKLGYALDDQEFRIGMRCVAAPILAQGEAIGALSVSGLASRMTKEAAITLGPRVNAIAQDLSKALRGMVQETKDGP